MNNIKVGKINKVSDSRIFKIFEVSEQFNISNLGVSKKCKGDGVVICIFGSGMPSHEKIPKISIFENFTSEKDPLIDVINTSTIGAGLIVGDGMGLLENAEIIFSKVIDNKGNISLSSIVSGLLWACIKQVNIITLPCSIKDEFMPDLEDLLKKTNSLGISVIMPIDKNEEDLTILNTNHVLGVKPVAGKTNDWKINEVKKNVIEIVYPRGIKIFSPYGVYKYAKLLTKESSPFVATSLLGAICSRRKKKGLSISYKNLYPDLISLQK